MQIFSAFELSFNCNIVLGLILFIRSQFQYVLCSRLNVMRFFCGVWSVKKTLANNVVKDKYQCRSLFSFHISLLTSSITEIHKAQTLNSVTAILKVWAEDNERSNVQTEQARNVRRGGRGRRRCATSGQTAPEKFKERPQQLRLRGLGGAAEAIRQHRLCITW